MRKSSGHQQEFNLLTLSPLPGHVTIAATNNVEIAVSISSNFDHSNTLTLSAGNQITIYNGNDLGIKGSLLLQANNGVLVQSSIHSNGALTVNADLDGDGSGILTVASGKQISTRNSELTVTASDLHLNGDLASGSAITRLVPTNQHDIGLGNGNKAFHVSDAELGNVAATGGLSIGAATNYAFTVDGVTEENSNDIGMLSLLSSVAGGIVTFVNTESRFHKGISIQANDGVVLSESVTTLLTETNLDAGTGVLTVFTLL